ncbi:unnamed protein product [Cuscuta europaea]|uniref:Uncharacterized protein n=1 Tax=Cuscuta europaea TaxID=41803 RepID=A0A9P0ZJ40_CUSEU|nr:unnamed protein product [Cuscuta europaea]
MAASKTINGDCCHNKCDPTSRLVNPTTPQPSTPPHPSPQAHHTTPRPFLAQSRETLGLASPLSTSYENKGPKSQLPGSLPQIWKLGRRRQSCSTMLVHLVAASMKTTM